MSVQPYAITSDSVKTRDGDVLSRVFDFILSDNASGYITRTGLEFVPLPFAPLWAVGDLLGFFKGMRTYSSGRLGVGILKIITAILPLFPTAPTHAIIDNLFGRDQKRLAVNS